MGTAGSQVLSYTLGVRGTARFSWPQHPSSLQHEDQLPLQKQAARLENPKSVKQFPVADAPS